MPDTTSSGPVQHVVPPVSWRRRITDRLMTGAAVLTVLLVLAPLVAIFGYLVYRGVGAIDWAFLTQTPKPAGEVGGGMANAIVGSAFMLGVASLIGVPFGVGAGIYLAEFGRNRVGFVIRFTADVLNGVPSIVIGIVAWSIMVRGRGFSALAGGVALAIMMVPTICRTTEEMLLLVPQALREAAYGLGVPRWRTTLSIVLRTATSGVITGWRSRAWPERRRRCCLQRWGTNSGICAWISPRRRCRCKFTVTHCRPMTTFTGRLGRERWC